MGIGFVGPLILRRRERRLRSPREPHLARRTNRPPGRRSRGWFFRTKQPHHVTWLVALLLAALGVVGTRAHIQWVSGHTVWVLLAAYVVLALGTVIDGL